MSTFAQDEDAPEADAFGEPEEGEPGTVLTVLLPLPIDGRSRSRTAQERPLRTAEDEE